MKADKKTWSPCPGRHPQKSLGARILCTLATTLLLALRPASAAEPPPARIAPSYPAWLEAVRPFASSEEIEIYRSLSSDIEREHFIDAFWQRRDRNQRQRFAENQEAAKEARHRAKAMDRVVYLAGKPGKTKSFFECGTTLRRFALWEYNPWQIEHQTGVAATEGVYVVFYQDIRGDPRSYRVWNPAVVKDQETLASGERWEATLKAALETGERQGCLDRETPEELVEGFQEGLGVEELASTFGWSTGDEPLPSAFDEGRFGAGRLEIDYPGKFFQRTILRGQVSLPVELLASPDGDFLFDRITVEGDIYRGLQLVDGFAAIYHLAGTVPGSPSVTLDFYRRLFPSPYALQIRVLDSRGRVLLREDRPLRVPKLEEPAPFPAGRRGDFNQLTRGEVISLVTFPSVRLLPPSAEHVPGSLRLQAVTTGGPIASVEFLRGEESLGLDSEPPYTAEVEVREGRATLRVVARDPEGRPLASDERVVLTRSHGFEVRFLEPAPRGSGRLSLEVTLPEGETLEVLECWLGDRRVETGIEAPYSCPSSFDPNSLPAPSAPAFARAVARLASGAETEDVVFLLATPAEEVDVQVAELYVSVVDGKGRPVTGLTAKEFQISSGRDAFSVVSVEGISSLPVYVAVAMDISSSMGTRVRTASASAQRFFESLLEENDQASLISFNHDLRRRVPFTNDVEALRYGALGARAFGSTRLWDALIYSLSSFTSLPDRRALVALTDGSDTESDFLFEQVLDAALKARVMIFPITLARLDEKTDSQLEDLARETGGVAFRAQDISDLDRIYQRIEDLLRSQYLIVYRRPTGARDPRAGAEASSLSVQIKRPGLVAHSVRRKI